MRVYLIPSRDYTKILILSLISIANLCYFEEPETGGGLNLQEGVEQDPRPRNTPTKIKNWGSIPTRQETLPLWGFDP